MLQLVASSHVVDVVVGWRDGEGIVVADETHVAVGFRDITVSPTVNRDTCEHGIYNILALIVPPLNQVGSTGLECCHCLAEGQRDVGSRHRGISQGLRRSAGEG